MIRALVYRKSIPRYVALKSIGRKLGPTWASRLAPVSLEKVPEKKLPTSQWVRIAPTLAGICGSDLATVFAKGSPYLAPVTSMPFVLGHELVGRVVEVGSEINNLAEGQRVVLRPALGCRVRGIADLCSACRVGQDALCRNVTRGDISAGIQTGYCRDTGGAFGDNLVAHVSQVYRVPDELDDGDAVLIEPFACALHGVLRAPLHDGDTAFVLGCGTIGLLTIAALRATDFSGRIVASAKHAHQRELASALGADSLVSAGGSLPHRYNAWSRELDAEVLDPELGKPTVIGGAAVTFDCIASPGSIDDAMRFTKSAGTCVLVGMPGAPPKVDWTPMWFKELSIRAAYAYGPEESNEPVQDTFEIAIEMMKSWGAMLRALLSKPYPLANYREAFAAAAQSGRTGAAKTIFDLTL